MTLILIEPNNTLSSVFNRLNSTICKIIEAFWFKTITETILSAKKKKIIRSLITSSLCAKVFEIYENVSANNTKIKYFFTTKANIKNGAENIRNRLKFGSKKIWRVNILIQHNIYNGFQCVMDFSNIYYLLYNAISQ